MDQARQTFAPSEELLQSVIDAQTQQAQQQAGQLRGGMERSVADIIGQARARGMNVNQLRPDEQARIMAAGEGAVGSQQAQAGFAGTELGGLLAGLGATRREAGRSLQDEERQRRQQLTLAREDMRGSERMQRERSQAQLQAQQIRAQRAAAERAQREAQARAQQQRQQESESLQRATNLYLRQKMGADGHVSPTDFRRARTLWEQNGGSASEFTAIFEDFINPLHYRDYTAEGGREFQRRRHGTGVEWGRGIGEF